MRDINEVRQEAKEHVDRYGFAINVMESYDIVKDEIHVTLFILGKNGELRVSWPFPSSGDKIILPELLAKALRQFADKIEKEEIYK